MYYETKTVSINISLNTIFKNTIKSIKILYMLIFYLLNIIKNLKFILHISYDTQSTFTIFLKNIAAFYYTWEKYIKLKRMTLVGYFKAFLKYGIVCQELFIFIKRVLQ